MEQETSFAFVDMTIVKTENDLSQNFMMMEYEGMADTKPEIIFAQQKLLDPDSIMKESVLNRESFSIYTECNNQLSNEKSNQSKVAKLELVKEELETDPLLVPNVSSSDEIENKKVTSKNHEDGDEKPNIDENCNEKENKKSLRKLLPLAVSSFEDIHFEPALSLNTGKHTEQISEIKKISIAHTNGRKYPLEENCNFALENKDQSGGNQERIITNGQQSKNNSNYLHTDNKKQLIAQTSNESTNESTLYFDLNNRKRGRGRPRVLFKKTHPCSICHKVFSRKTHLTTHLRIHSDEKPFTCNLCGKQFRDNSVLIKHIRVHTQDKPYACMVCGKAFNQKGNMERHARQHTNEKPFICSVCQNAFSNKSHLQRHFRIHDNEKPFTCELCQKSFRQKSHLMRHVLVHSREKPYTCNLCGKSFRQEQHVTRHKKTHIKEMITNVLLRNCITKSIHPRYLKFE